MKVLNVIRKLPIKPVANGKLPMCANNSVFTSTSQTFLPIGTGLMLAQRREKFLSCGQCLFGDRVPPAVVAYHEMEVVTGLAAKQGMIRHAANTIQNVLRVPAAVKMKEPVSLMYHVVLNGKKTKCGGTVQRGEKTATVTAEEVLTHIFTLLKGIAMNQTSESEPPLL
ncbi:heat shock 70 kDa protein 14-like [Penaeus vannamei]|uniref:heat shock 70 kDa protein 14-like n=1 Tax=Penaeus vannamei TaxID=6689 RepID=UPI00387F53ED